MLQLANILFFCSLKFESISLEASLLWHNWENHDKIDNGNVAKQKV